MAGPHSTTEAPTLNESTIQAPKRGSSSLGGEAPPKTIKGNSADSAGLPTGAQGAPPSDVEMPLTGTGKEMADIGGQVGGSYSTHKPHSNFSHRQNTYTKSHKFMTFGLAPNIILYAQTLPATQMGAFLTTYLAEIPWHLPALYMNPSEFALLDAGASVKHVSIEVYYRGSTIQFETAASTSGLATLNQLNDIAVATALNKSGQGQNVSMKAFNGSQSMIPDQVAKPKYDAVGTSYRGMVNDYYGTDNANGNFINYIPHHQLGRQTFLYNYWALSAVSSGPANNVQFGGWPTLSDKIHQIDGKTAVNTCVLKMEYSPKMGMLTAPLKNVGHGLPWAVDGPNNINVCVGNQLGGAKHVAINMGTPSSSVGQPVGSAQEDDNIANTTSPITYTLYTPIEKSQFAKSGLWGEMDAHIQPSAHIGVQPVPSLTTSSTLTNNVGDGTWTDVRAYWEVIATMHTNEHDPTAYPFATIPNVPLGDVIYYNTTTLLPAVNLNPRNDGATVQGLYMDATTTLSVDI